MVTVERLEQYIKDFLSRMHVECLIHGNVNQQKATALASIVEQKLQKTNANTLPLLSRQLLLKREYKLVNQESYRFITENEFHKSSCAELYLQCGMQSDKANVYIDLVRKIHSHRFTSSPNKLILIFRCRKFFVNHVTTHCVQKSNWDTLYFVHRVKRMEHKVFDSLFSPPNIRCMWRNA